MPDSSRCSSIVLPLTDLVVEDKDAVVIISHSTGICRAVTINETGLRVWRLIDGQRTVDDIVETTLGLWLDRGCSEQQVREDVVEFLDRLAAEGCVGLVSQAADGEFV